MLFRKIRRYRWLTYRISLHLLVAARRQSEVELEVEDEAELVVVELLRQFTRVYQPVLSVDLVQLAVRSFRFTLLLPDM
jgi:hypothetical protein